MGDYFLVQNDDGVGTKIRIAEKIDKYDTLGFDLIAMVADDAACIGAETISVSNTLDVNKLDEKKVAGLMSGLETAALNHKIIVPGGEIAELGDSVNGYIWNATAVGIVEKNKVIKADNFKSGDKIIGLKSDGLRSNGFSLVRYILNEKFGTGWHFEKFDNDKNWGEAVLTPSKIYSSAIMDMHGRYREKPKVSIKAIAHITGGGIPGNLQRILKKSGLGAKLDNLPAPHEIIYKLMEIGNVEKEEAYKTWNMGIGMIIISNEYEQIDEICQKHEIKSQIIGEISEGKIILE